MQNCLIVSALRHGHRENPLLAKFENVVFFPPTSEYRVGCSCKYPGLVYTVFTWVVSFVSSCFALFHLFRKPFSTTSMCLVKILEMIGLPHGIRTSPITLLMESRYYVCYANFAPSLFCYSCCANY